MLFFGQMDTTRYPPTQIRLVNPSPRRGGAVVCRVSNELRKGKPTIFSQFEPKHSKTGCHLLYLSLLSRGLTHPKKKIPNLQTNPTFT